MKLKNSGIPPKNLDKNDDFVYSIPLFCCRVFFLNKKTEIIVVLGVIFFFKYSNKSILTGDAIPGKKCSTSEKKSIFND
jgi:hypothetical protein